MGEPLEGVGVNREPWRLPQGLRNARQLKLVPKMRSAEKKEETAQGEQELKTLLGKKIAQKYPEAGER